MAGMQAAGSAVVAAFGGDQKGLVLGIVNVIEKAALIAVEFGLAGVKAAGVVSRGFAGIKAMLVGVKIGFVTLGGTVVDLVATVLEAASSIPVLGERFKASASAARFAADAAGAFNASLKIEMQDALLAATGNDTFGRSLTTVAGILNTTKEAIVNAGLSQRELNMATAEGVIQTTNLGTTVAAFGAQIGEWMPTAEGWREELGRMGEDAKSWSGIVGESSNAAAMSTSNYGFVATSTQDMVIAAHIRAGESARSLGITTREESKKMEEEITKHLENIVEAYGEYSDEAIAAQEKLDEFRKQSTEDTNAAMISSHEAFSGGAATVFNALGGRYQKFAAAEGAISALLASVKTMATTPWPMNIPMAAAAFAAGMAVVSAIKSAASPGFRKGTLGFDFQDFGSSTPTILHGREAVIPAGGGHQLADEIASALARTKRLSRDSERGEELAMLRSVDARLASLPRSIQRSMRDAVLLAG